MTVTSGQIKEKHIFSFGRGEYTKNFEKINLANFSLTTFSETWNNQEKNINNIFGNGTFRQIQPNETILDIILQLNDGIYIKANAEKTISYSDLKELIIKYEQNTTTADDNNIIRAIQSSNIGSVAFSFHFPNEPYLYVLYFKFLSQVNTGKRVTVGKGLPTFAAVPKVNGQPFGFKNTNLLRGSTNGMGLYAPKSEEENIDDFVTAELDLSYDNSTKKWVAGNQTLARLITNVDAADIKNADITESSLPGLLNTDFYDPESDYYLGGHTTGLAIPLSIENGDPNNFGPNCIDCGTQRVQKIRVVNRSARSFTVGSLVLLNKINGEWIIQDFGTNPDDQKPSKVEAGEWAFVKLIANSDAFFKDGRFYDNPTQFNQTVRPSDYETSARFNFYNNFKKLFDNNNVFLNTIYPGVTDLTKTYDENKVNLQGYSAIEPSNRYFISTIFDQSPSSLGGYSQELQFWNKTNLYAPENNFIDLGPYGREVPLFWGPVYIEGYTISKILVNQSLPDNQPNEKLYFSRTATVPSYNQQNQIFKNFPAEFASKMIDLVPLFNADFNNIGLNNTPKFGNNIIIPPYYGSDIISRYKVQFSPLQAEMAGHDDILSPSARSSRRRFYDIARAIFPTNGNMWGNMFTRSKEYKYNPILSESSNFSLDDCGVYTNIAYNNLPHVPYDCFIKNTPTNVPVGVVDDFRDNNNQKIGGNLVGVIAAIHKITKKRGGNILFEVDQDFGLNQKQTVTGSADPVNIIGGWIIGGGATSIRQNAFPQWGSSTDSYDSFGTTALHVRVFDGWPTDQTVYDPRYFAVLHFNPGPYGPNAANVDEEGNDKQEYDIDVRIPTYLNNTVVPFNTIIDSTVELKPKAKWRINTIRRGQLLTGGGFWSAIQHITLPNKIQNSYAIASAGSNFVIDQQINASKDIIIKITEVDENGGLINFEFFDSPFGNKLTGNDFLPQDFSADSSIENETRKCYKLNIISPNGDNAVIEFYHGVLDFRYRVDLPPTEQIPITRLTSSSDRGATFVRGVQSTEKSVEQNDTGTYDCFYFFHNDISHTFMEALSYTAGFAQKIGLTIS